MKVLTPVQTTVHAELKAIYEQMMWLARRPNVTAATARAWYTHVMAQKLKRRIRRFTGKVSQAAIDSKRTALRLEHYKRIQATLTDLVNRHLALKSPDSKEFIRTVLKCERVHIVTIDENNAAKQAKGNYNKAGIVLVHWKSIPPKRQDELWRKMLRGKVANADAFRTRT